MKGDAPLVSESIDQAKRDLVFSERRLAEVELQIGEMSRGGEPLLERLAHERSSLKQEIDALKGYLGT